MWSLSHHLDAVKVEVSMRKKGREREGGWEGGRR